jgi:hypothetical protein
MSLSHISKKGHVNEHKRHKFKQRNSFIYTVAPPLTKCHSSYQTRFQMHWDSGAHVIVENGMKEWPESLKSFTIQKFKQVSQM